MALKARIYGDHDGDKVSESCGLACLDVSRTVQSQAEEADINTIVKNFGVTGRVPQSVRVPMYGDFTDSVSDYRTAVEAVMAAEESFMKMPAELRARLNNDPQEFLDFCADPANLPELRKLGLAVPEVTPPVVPAGDSPAS